MQPVTNYTIRLFTIIAIVCSVLLLPKLAQPAYANPQWGYLWELHFSFDHSFNAELILKVGPWQQGGIIVVEEKSTTPVLCHPVGNVTLQKGYANFDGTGYLQCQLDIASALMANHGMAANAVDTYADVNMWADVQIATTGVAPLFSHPDANFWVTAPSPWMATLNSDLNNNNGVMTATFSATPWHTWQSYRSDYTCPFGNPCSISQSAGANSQSMLNQGDPAQFATANTTITIGRMGTENLRGRISYLGIDPPNHGHGG